jgi:copper(I)-binding protein
MLITTSVRRLAAAASLALTLGVLSACGSSSTTSPSASSKVTVTVTDAYVNAPTVPGRTGAFATVSNNGATAVTLTSVSVPGSAAGSAELHETVMSNGAMTMQPVPAGVAVPANGVLTLKSGGYHIMLMDPKVTVGQTVPITFEFSDGTSVEADAMVKAVQASPMPTASS